MSKIFFGVDMSEKTKFKVCKTDLGMDKVYPEGSIVSLDANEDWVDDLCERGILVPVYDPFAEAEAEAEAESEAERLRAEETERLNAEAAEKAIAEEEARLKAEAEEKAKTESQKSQGKKGKN